METTLTIDLLTLFPGMARGYLDESIIGRSIKHGLLAVHAPQHSRLGQGKTQDYG